MTISKKHSKQTVTAGLEKHVTFRALFREQRVKFFFSLQHYESVFHLITSTSVDKSVFI